MRYIFDSDNVEQLAQLVLRGPLRLPHDEVMFEIVASAPTDDPLVAYVETGPELIDGYLFRYWAERNTWSDVLALASFRDDGVAEVAAHPRLITSGAAEMHHQALTGAVWRALGLLAAGCGLQQQSVSPLRRRKFAKDGVRGWTYRLAEIDPSRFAASLKGLGGTHASPRWHIRRGHWRQLADGRRVFVRECEVGDAVPWWRRQGLPHAARRSAHERHHALRHPAPRHRRDQGVVRERHRAAAGVPAVRLCRHRQIDRAALRAGGTRPREPQRSGGDGEVCVPGVVTATFTGKAALVLRRKGTPARTIHSLIYSVIEATEEEVEAAEKKIDGGRCARARRSPASSAPPPRRRSRPCARRVAEMKRPRFALNPKSDAAHARLIVLDEVSMVGEDMARDLMSFGKPILVLGDPGQLPPIQGEGAFTKDAPDIMLTEIHRQAAESAIIRLATMARAGRADRLRPVRHASSGRCASST